jgi:hypothetical protein
MPVEKRALSQYSDSEVLDLYEKHDKNAEKASREVGCGPSTFQKRIRLITDPTYVNDKDKETAITFLMEELEARGIDPRQINIKQATVKTDKGTWDSMYKNAQKEGVKMPMKRDRRSVQIQFSPKFEEGPAWPVIQQPAPKNVKYITGAGPVKSVFAKRVFIIPDAQIGYYRDINTMELTPFHDTRAIAVMLQMLKIYKPDTVVILGDFLDLPSLSKYLQVAEFQLTLQPAIEYAYELLCQVRSIVGPNCQIEYIEGNHERRMSEYIARNALAAYGLRRAASVPGAWPVLSVPNLLLLQELGINYSATYPSGQFWLTPKLVCTHQPPGKKDLRASVIHGHTPHYRVESRSVHYIDGIETYSIHSVPGLMHVDDIAEPQPLVRSQVPSDGTRMNWQQGVATVDILNDDVFKVVSHPIANGEAIFGDKVLQSW